MTETFYEVLGVPPDASDAAIRDAYRERVKETHPDVSDHPEAEARFKRVKRAEEVLGDAEERAAYDRLGHAAYVGDERAPADPDVGSVDDEVRAAAARAAGDDHDPGGRSAAWRERERRAAQRGRDFWAEHFDGFADDARENARSDDVGAASAGGRTGPASGASTAGTGPGTGDDRSGRTASTAAAAAGGPTAGTTARRERSAPDGWGSETTVNHSYAVRDWGDSGQGLGVELPDWTQDEVALLTATLFVYPIVLFMTVLPPLPAVANVAIGLLALTFVAFLLPRPSFGIPVFGTWSLLVPAILLGFDVPLVSTITLVTLSGVWLPLLYSVAVAFVLVR